jgi:hypothetical protein
MGWTSFQIHKTDKTIDILRKELEQTDQGMTRPRFKLIEASMKGSTMYGIMELTTWDTSTPDGSTRERSTYFGIVCLTERKNTFPQSQYVDFYYKDMDESMQPFYFDCPARILDKLDKLAPATEPASGAYKWRAACRKHRERAAARNALKKFISQHITFVKVGA